MKTLDLVVCKVVSTELFPGRGWIGIVETETNKRPKLAALLTRPELYKRASDIMQQHGENAVRARVAQFRVPDCFKVMFASDHDAHDQDHAKRLFEMHMGD